MVAGLRATSMHVTLDVSFSQRQQQQCAFCAGPRQGRLQLCPAQSHGDAVHAEQTRACIGLSESAPRGNVLSMNSSKLRAAASPPSPACLPRSRLHVAWPLMRRPLMQMQ